MAEYAAHIAGTSQGSPFDSEPTDIPNSRPSFFELLAQESLSNGLRKALKYAAQIAANHNPSKFHKLYTRFEEIYLALDTVIQYSHLRAFNASFSENFYGIKRVPCIPIKEGDPRPRLQSRQFWGSLFILVSFPYFREKLNNYHERLKLRHAQGQLNPVIDVFECQFLRIYPTLSAIFHMIEMIHQIGYAVNRMDCHSLLLRLASVRLENQTLADFKSHEIWTEILQPNLSWPQYLARFSWLSWKWLATKFGVALSTGAFFLQFLEFWYTRQDAPPSFAPLPVPPPPDTFPHEFRADICPICHKIRRNETVLATTGFIFCYACIRDHIEQQRRCPITGFPSELEHLVKLYPPSE